MSSILYFKLKWVLNENRSSGELNVKQGKTCLPREDICSYGLSQLMEYNVRMLSVLLYCKKKEILDNA